MNASIKRRQTLLINWLQSVINCDILSAKSGSQYITLNTQYTGKVTIRISDHMSNESKYVNVILSALNSQVIVNYKNFVWSGEFNVAKHVIYAFAMGKAMLELSTNPIDRHDSLLSSEQKQLFQQYVRYWKKDVQAQLKHYFLNNPEYATQILKFLTSYSLCNKSIKYSKFVQFKKEMNFG